MSDPAAYWSPICKLRADLRCWVHLAWREGTLIQEGYWGQLLTMPEEGYLEGPAGPTPLRDVEWVEVSTCRIKGGLVGVPRQLIDVKDEILAGLRGMQINWELRDGMWSVVGLFADEPVQVVRIVNPFREAGRQ